jgi:hypothetical protein
MKHPVIQHNLVKLLQQIAAYEQQYGRPAGSVKLLAVSKGQDFQKIEAAYATGQLAFGENYVQEALAKMAVLHSLPLEWHYIGRIQSNKIKLLSSHFDWVQTLTSSDIARCLHEHRPIARSPLNVCIQVNISQEITKEGIAPNQVIDLAHAIAALPRLRLRGVMAVPAAVENIEQQRQQCAKLKTVYEQLQQAGFAVDTLSMGMSQDLEAAIAEGATLVRVGTTIFGPRS